MTLAISLERAGPGKKGGELGISEQRETRGTGKLLCGQQGTVPGGTRGSRLFPVSLEGEGAEGMGQTLDRKGVHLFRLLASQSPGWGKGQGQVQGRVRP